MGKGGRANVKKSVVASSSSSSSGAETWKSPYNPLDPNAPKLPTKGEIKASIPAHCFDRSYIWGMAYLIRDFIIAGGFVYATSQVLSTDLPSLDDPVGIATYVFGWSFYAFWMGTIMTGPWVVAHECGHGAFSPSQTWNDIVGFVVHQALLVPYFAWQYTHAKHHRRTNHLTDGESHVPSTAKDNGLGGPNMDERHSFYAAWHEAMGDGAFAGFQVWTHLAVGWPLYLLGLASTGKLDANGEPLNGRIADHFRTNSPMFPAKISWKIRLSTATTVASIAGLFYAQYEYGFMPVLLWYWNPYFFVNGTSKIYSYNCLFAVQLKGKKENESIC